LLAGGIGAIGFVLWRAVHGAAMTLARGEYAHLGASMHVAAMVARRERLPFAVPIAVGSLAAWWLELRCADVAACLGGSVI
jgi:prepilin signal peptidase PulO-like enzyme (type II secretory pathway)